jgi:hypothetical protein
MKFFSGNKPEYLIWRALRKKAEIGEKRVCWKGCGKRVSFLELATLQERVLILQPRSKLKYCKELQRIKNKEQKALTETGFVKKV